MPFTFNPGQQNQTGQPSQPSQPAKLGGSEAPPLIVPTIPTISVSAAPVEVLSPFAYKNRGKSKFSMYFQFAIFAVFGVAVLVSVYLFVWQLTLKAQIENRKSDLTSKESGFPKLKYDEMQKLSDRLAIINRVMNEHASVNTAFKILEASIENPVTYTKFNLSKNKNKTGYNLNFAGETNSYSSLYQQIEALNSKTFANYFSKMTISGLGPLDKKGIGIFKVDTTVSIEGINPDTFSLTPKTNESSSTEVVSPLNTEATSTSVVTAPQ